MNSGHTGVAPVTRRAVLKGAGAVALSVPFVRSGGAQESSKSLTLGWVKSTTNLAAYLAPTFSEKHGLKVESVNFNNAVDISTAMLSGDIDVGLLTPIHLIRAIESNIDFVQICGNSRVDSTIVAAKKLDLAAEDWDALRKLVSQRKLKVASSRASINDLLGVDRFAKNGIDPDKDIEISNIPSFAQHPQALRSGDFDMAITIEPLASIAVADGVGTVFSRVNELDGGPVKTIYVVRRDWLEKNGDNAQAFVKTLADAVKLLSTDKEAESEAGLQVTGLKPEVLEMAISINQYDLSNGLQQMEKVAAIAVERKYIAKDVTADIKNHVDERFVAAAGIGD